MITTIPSHGDKIEAIILVLGLGQVYYAEDDDSVYGSVPVPPSHFRSMVGEMSESYWSIRAF